jgi:hypothetical protein
MVLICALLRKNLGQEAEVAWGDRRIALARGGLGGLLARGNASGVGNLKVDIVGATHSLTKVVAVMLIVIVVGVLLSAWVGGV